MQVEPTFAVEANHVDFSYGTNKALENVSFAVPEGRYIGIVGPNGGGKTTLIKIILGLFKPDLGTISVFGKNPSEARRSGNIGYISQRLVQSDFPFPATVREMVETGCVTNKSGTGFFSQTKKSKSDKALNIVGLGGFENRNINSLSGGERQRVFIARSLVSEPRLLILDEPTTGVDPGSREHFYNFLKKLNTEHGLTILFVSHDVDTIVHQANFILVLNQKLICHCSSHNFLTNQTLAKLYGSDEELLHRHSH